MKLETFTTDIKEVSVHHDKTYITVSTWGNLEGCTLIICRDDLSTQLAGPLTWSDVDALICALTAARSI